MSANTPPPSSSNHVENSNSSSSLQSDSNLSSSQLPRTPPKANKNRTCRNVIIHGFCKYEHSGCEFNHDLSNNKPSPGSPETKSKLRVDSPVFNPSSFRSIENINVPTYLPTSSPKIQSQQNPYYVPVQTDNSFQCDMYYGNPAARTNPAQYISAQVDTNSLTNSMSNFNIGSPERIPIVPAIGNINNFYQTNPVLDSYYYNQPQQPTQQAMNIKISPQQPLQYHLYSTPLIHHGTPQNHGSIHSFFISDKLREELQKKNEAINKVIDLTSPEYQNFPRELHVYHSFNILDDHHEKSSKTFGYPTSVYKSISSIDGKAYELRRVEGYRLANEIAMKSIENWRRIDHSNIISLKEAFTTKAFGDHSLIFVYDYYPLSKTLESEYLSSNQVNEISETTIWSMIIQITSALKAIHSAGLAARTLKANKILVTGKNRIRLSCCGMLDLLNYDGGKNYMHYQQEDLLHFGQLILSLACGSNVAIQNLSTSIDYISRQHSMELKSVILYLLSKPNPMKNIDDIISMTGPRLLQELENTNQYTDYMQSELSRELENGRLVRLLCKLGTINERPEFDMDPAWSETGDRYLLKLFRDYVFHQVDENGKPFIDMAHILQCLNKLDVGVDEKVMLMSRDEQSCLIVSYNELKKCVEQAFQDLRK